jgi:hypothetical protein
MTAIDNDACNDPLAYTSCAPSMPLAPQTGNPKRCFIWQRAWKPQRLNKKSVEWMSSLEDSIGSRGKS